MVTQGSALRSLCHPSSLLLAADRAVLPHCKGSGQREPRRHLPGSPRFHTQLRAGTKKGKEQPAPQPLEAASLACWPPSRGAAPAVAPQDAPLAAPHPQAGSHGGSIASERASCSPPPLTACRGASGSSYLRFYPPEIFLLVSATPASACRLRGRASSFLKEKSFVSHCWRGGARLVATSLPVTPAPGSSHLAPEPSSKSQRATYFSK